YSGARHRLQAGEYLFDQPLTIPEVIAKLTSGTVLLHKLTVPEGFTTEAIAHKWQEDGFGSAEDFMKAASGAMDLVQRFDQNAVSVEGYLFPDTYSFRKHTTARQAIEAMVGRFQQVVGKLKKQRALMSGLSISMTLLFWPLLSRPRPRKLMNGRW